MVPGGMLSSEAPQKITFSRRPLGLHIQCPRCGLGHKDLGIGARQFLRTAWGPHWIPMELLAFPLNPVA